VRNTAMMYSKNLSFPSPAHGEASKGWDLALAFKIKPSFELNKKKTSLSPFLGIAGQATGRNVFLPIPHQQRNDFLPAENRFDVGVALVFNPKPWA
jgi:hypothetical protein